MSNPIALKLEGIHAGYGELNILENISLEIPAKTSLAVLGRNGVGKTSIIKTIAGWLPPSKGEIIFQGKNIAAWPSEKIARLGIALVPEDRRIFAGLTVEDNLKMGLMQLSSSIRAKHKPKIAELYEQFPRLLERKNQLGNTLSGGEQQMLAIARALVGSPQLILIDEPTEGLAPMIVNEIFTLLKRLREQGVSILLIEQNVHKALQLCDRHYAIERGSVVDQGSSNQQEDVVRLMKNIAV
jgi:branched-chain amino acid transport system ATP-binding protein